ncbi:MAG: ABC transporter ATP-binding protein [Hyphomicrobiales bacterium]|nr:ABC transporter ATP-binding protein [Hyphomicrobiales bacterium]MBV8827828.1 ABC transporter ATP-binding protein [Acidobacteriaceae bacterium]MBV8768581.1 ABC transporter ATP-binding protein [Hyphomicrobiales bacterium]MBV9054658.1 ABC transporter ATP-binding protein [Hyphomicrobiales bacterium]MBV9136090.1 ABC transporter ATP-binding protein [Hyphomicrobiales bacterium]
MAHIKLSDVGVEFPIHNAHSRSLQLQVFGKLGGKLAQHKQAIFVQALQGVNLSFEDGDRVGVIGHNGAGKTTLLRVLAGVYEPTYGTMSIEGRLSSFTDITLGMDPEATGLENIIFRCVFMGLSFAEARRLSPSIQEFSELGEFLRLPVRTYSSGMFLRLAFAISTSIEPDIIIMDEMISGGDARFMERAKARLTSLLERTKILILASHSAEIMQSLCNKVIWLDHGEVRKIGSFEEVHPAYLDAYAG